MKTDSKILYSSPVNGLYILSDHAKILKELGFDWPTRGYYFKKFANKDTLTFRLLYRSENHNDPVYNQTEFYSAPSIYRATEWLREEKGIYVESIMRSPTMFEAVGKVFVEDACPQVRYLFDLWDVDAGIVFPSYEIGLLYGIGAALLRLKNQKK